MNTAELLELDERINNRNGLGTTNSLYYYQQNCYKPVVHTSTPGSPLRKILLVFLGFLIITFVVVATVSILLAVTSLRCDVVGCDPFLGDGISPFSNELNFLDDENAPWNHHQLPIDVEPIHAILKLKFEYLSRNHILGSVNYRIRCNKTTKSIILHASPKLSTHFSSGRQFIQLESGRKLHVKRVFQLREYFVILTYQSLREGSIYNLTLHFTVPFQNADQPWGLIKYTYFNHQNKRFFILSSLYPSFSRYLFPCWDEPKWKYAIQLEVVHNSEFNVISNSIEQTYLITSVFVMKSISPHYLALCLLPNGTQKYYLHWINQDKNIKVQFYLLTSFHISPKWYDVIANATRTSLDYLSKRFQEPKFHKLDIIFLEKEHPFTSLGVIAIQVKGKTLLETVDLLVREIIHQWFGVDVSFKWWDQYVFLEAIVQYLHHLLLPEIFTNSKVSKLITAQQLELNYIVKICDAIEYDLRFDMSRLDSFRNSSSLEILKTMRKIPEAKILKISHTFRTIDKVQGSKPAKIENILKSIFRQEKHLFSFEWFTSQLKQFHIGSKFESPLNLKNWLFSPHFPVVNVQIQPTQYVVHQSDLSLFKNTDVINDNWVTPLSLVTEESQNIHWINGPSRHWDVTPSLWFMANHDLVTWTIVNYTSDVWEIFSDQFKTRLSKLSNANRYILVHNAFILTKYHLLSPEIFLKLVEFLDTEKSVHLWKILDQAMTFFAPILYQDETLNLLFKVRVMYPKWNYAFKECRSFQETKNQLVCRTIVPKWACYTEVFNSNRTCKNSAKAFLNTINGFLVAGNKTFTDDFDYKNLNLSSDSKEEIFSKFLQFFSFSATEDLADHLEKIKNEELMLILIKTLSFCEHCINSPSRFQQSMLAGERKFTVKQSYASLIGSCEYPCANCVSFKNFFLRNFKKLLQVYGASFIQNSDFCTYLYTLSLHLNSQNEVFQYLEIVRTASSLYSIKCQNLLMEKQIFHRLKQIPYSISSVQRYIDNFPSVER